MRRWMMVGLCALLAAACSKDEGADNGKGGAKEPEEPAEKPATTADAAPGAATKGEPDAAPAASSTPDFEPPFAFKIAAKPMDYKKNQFIWAAYPLNKTGGWGYNKVRFQEAVGEWAKVKTLATFHTHSAFLYNPDPPDAAALEKGTPVKVHVGVGVKYGRVEGVSGDKVKVKYYVSGPKSGESELPLSSVELWTKPALDPGTPVVYDAGAVKKLATLLHAAGGKVYIAGPKSIEELDEGAVTPVDPSVVFKKGAKVWAYAKKGMGSYKMTEGVITKVHDGGVWYEWKASEGKQIAKVSYSRVVKK